MLFIFKRLVNMVSFDLEVDEVTDSGISCTVTIPSGPLDVSVFVMATFYADVTKGTKTYCIYCFHLLINRHFSIGG